MEEKEFTHITNKGVHMVDVSNKPVIKRTALAQGSICLQKKTIKMIKEDRIKKGNVLATAQIAAIEAVKSTHHIIPLCHSLKITGINVNFDLESDDHITVQVDVRSLGKTGVEMEALTGVSVALLTIWDMVKSVEKDAEGQYPYTRISDVQVLLKEKK